MSKTISNAALGLYAGLVGMFVPIPGRQGLFRNLESDPFLGNTLQGAASELYHRYGTWLAPYTECGEGSAGTVGQAEPVADAEKLAPPPDVATPPGPVAQ